MLLHCPARRFSCTLFSLTASSKSLATTFRSQILNSKDRDAASLAPVRQFGEHSFLYYRAANVYLLAVTRANANAMMIFQFLSRVSLIIGTVFNACSMHINIDGLSP